MKHTAKVTVYLTILFIVAQIVGLSIINEYIDHGKTALSGKVEFKNLPGDIQRPEVEEQSAVAYILSAILIGTALVFVLIRFKKVMIWKTWFFISVLVCLTFAFGAYLPALFAFGLALVLALLKVYKPSLFVHNISEIFIYGGLAAIFVPMLNVLYAFILLFAISIYDMIAVWKSKHMVKLAKFQTGSKVFAGLMIPYDRKTKKIHPIKPAKIKKVIEQAPTNAILGGGDIGFPLIFAGTVLKSLLLTNPILIAFLKALIVPVCTTIALYILFLKGKKDKFYPAMPFLSLGCLVGYIIVILI